MFCKTCGSEIFDGVDICPKCWCPIEEDKQKDAVSKKKKTIIIICLAIVAIVGISLAIFFGLRGRNSESGKASEVESTASVNIQKTSNSDDNSANSSPANVSSTKSILTENSSDNKSSTQNSKAKSTSAKVDSSKSESTSKSTSASTTKPLKFPVGTDINEIVSFYNTAANSTKAYKGKMVIKAKQGYTTKITDTTFPSAAINIANGILPNDFPTDNSYNKNYTVTNGKAADGQSIQNILPINGDAKMSKLSASGVQSAKCAKTGNGYTIQIKLKPESVNSFDKLPANHSSCMNCIYMTSQDLEPFVCENCAINYTGANLVAVVNEKGMLTEFKVYNPIHITGTFKCTAIKGNATIDASWRQEAVISY